MAAVFVIKSDGDGTVFKETDIYYGIRVQIVEKQNNEIRKDVNYEFPSKLTEHVNEDNVLGLDLSGAEIKKLVKSIEELVTGKPVKRRRKRRTKAEIEAEVTPTTPPKQAEEPSAPEVAPLPPPI